MSERLVRVRHHRMTVHIALAVEHRLEVVGVNPVVARADVFGIEVVCTDVEGIVVCTLDVLTLGTSGSPVFTSYSAALSSAAQYSSSMPP